MKILIVSASSWSNQNSLGNTLSNWFEDWEDCEFAFMYAREAQPENKCCDKYYTVTLLDIIHNFYRPWKIGQCFDSKLSRKNSVASQQETKAMNSYSGFKRKLAYFIADTLYDTKVWLNKKTKSFIHDFNPDITFLFCLPDAYDYHIVKYIKTTTDSKIVEFVADDVFGQSFADNSLLNLRYRKRIPKLLKMADKIYGASEQLCDAYEKTFDINISPLYKGCTLSEPIQTVNSPLRILYAGNLYFGRAETLSRLVEVASKINSSDIKIELSIYSNSYISEEVRKRLNGRGCTLYPAKPYSEIKNLMNSSDIVLHVESFEEEQIQSVRYSFSTKIIDCLQSGAVMLAIGPKGIASIEFPKRIPGAIVIDDLSLLEQNLCSIVENAESLINKAKMLNNFAQQKFEINQVRYRLRKALYDLVKS